MDDHPLARIWSSLTPELRGAFAAAHAKHGRLSTSKAASALRTVDGVASEVLDRMAETTNVPDGFEHAKSDADLLSPLSTSPCVRHAAEALEAREGPYDDGDFLVALVRESTGATASQWKADGFDAGRVAEQVAETRKTRAD